MTAPLDLDALERKYGGECGPRDWRAILAECRRLREENAELLREARDADRSLTAARAVVEAARMYLDENVDLILGEAVSAYDAAVKGER